MRPTGLGLVLWSITLHAACEAEPQTPVFADGPLSLHDIQVGLGRDGVPHDLIIHARGRVRGGQPGRVTLPLRIACDVGEHRLVTPTRFVQDSTSTFPVDAADELALETEAGRGVAWPAPPARCELTFRLDPTADRGSFPVVPKEKRCWEGGALRAGPCSWSPPPRPAEALAVHDARGAYAGGQLWLTAALQSRDGLPDRGFFIAEARCGASAPLTTDTRLTSQEGAVLAPGESMMMVLPPLGLPSAAPAACDVIFGWVPIIGEQPEGIPTELARICVTATGSQPGPCPG